MAVCQGCAQRVYRLADGLHDSIADGGARHRCADPAQREHVVMSQEQYSLRCPGCGSRDVAESSWNRLVDFPDAIWLHPDWPEPLRAHVCVPSKPTGKPKPVWEAFRA